MKSLAVSLIRFYQKAVSPAYSFIFGGSFGGCRFYPSCSEYSITAITKHGPLRGGLKSFIRILKCNPWSRGGIDNP